ncbi:MAG: hypothetical protein HYX69_18580 [Planctomycetia bacterium]|nr:hypothetical protein [Planctomycetia bacterium]
MLLIAPIVAGLVMGVEFYPLPPDRASATFEVRQGVWDLKPVPAGRDAKDVPREISVTRTFVVRSVGTIQLDGAPCRWIEIKAISLPQGDMGDKGRILILKLLVPEKHFGDNSYPFAHVQKAYCLDMDWAETVRSDKASRIDEDKLRLQYELDRFLPLLPRPSRDAKETTNQTVAVPHGDVPAVLFDFQSQYEGKLSGGRSGEWKWNGQHRVWVSPSSPFGIVRVSLENTNIETDNVGRGMSMRSRTEMVLQSTGNGARTELPNCR